MSEIPFATICVSGEDAFGFLQGQLTSDLRDLEPGRTILSAWCNPKGRVICLFRVAQSETGYSLSLPVDLADAAVQRLTMFRFRSKVEFEIRPTTANDLGIENSFDEWSLANLRAGIADIGKAQSEEYTAHMLNLDELGVVSLDKGCYPGQEIIARTHYRGASKRRLARFESTADVSVGDKLSDGERNVGEIVNVIGLNVLAVVPVDAAERELTANGVQLKPSTAP